MQVVFEPAPGTCPAPNFVASSAVLEEGSSYLRATDSRLFR